MKVSVILPVYNQEKYVAESIESVLAQTFPDFEIIVINDGSNDDSQGVIEKYQGKIRIFRQENRGLATTLNRGLAEATGEYIAFIDGDDLWSKDKLEIQTGILDNNPDIDMTFGEMEQFLSPDLEHLAQKFQFKKGPSAGLMRVSMLARKEVYERYGSFTHVGFSEFVYWFDMARDNGLRYNQTKHLVAFRRIRENSLSQNPHYYPDLLKYLKKRMDEKRNGA